MSALDRLNHARVRDVASIPGPASEELFKLAAIGRREWTYREWMKVLDELDVSEETVSEFREFRE